MQVEVVVTLTEDEEGLVTLIDSLTKALMNANALEGKFEHHMFEGNPDSAYYKIKRLIMELLTELFDDDYDKAGKLYGLLIESGGAVRYHLGYNAGKIFGEW